MMVKKIINEKFLNVLFAGLMSYYFGQIVLKSYYKAGALLGLVIFVFIFLTKVEYAFYFLLATRGIIDVFYDFQAAGGLRITQVVGVGLAAIFLYYAIVVSQYNFFKLGINKIYIIFLVTSIPAIFFSESIRIGIAYWFRLFQGFAIIYLTIMIILTAGNDLYRKRIYMICCAVIITLFVPYLTFLKNLIHGVTVEGSGGIERVAAYGTYNNIFSYLLFTVFTFCLFLYSVSGKGFQRKVWFIPMGIIAYTIYYTYTRNIWIALTVLLFAWNLLRKNLLVSAISAVIVIVMISYNPTIQERLKDAHMILSNEGRFFDLDPGLLAGRIGIWQANIDYFMNQSTLMEKLMGNGFDIKTEIAFMYFSKIQDQGEHNNYLALLMSTGIFGLSAYLLYLFKLFQESFRLLKRAENIYTKSLAQVFISFLISYSILSAFTHISWNITFQQHFSVFAGFIVAANIIEERNRNKEHKYELAQNN